MLTPDLCFSDIIFSSALVEHELTTLTLSCHAFSPWLLVPFLLGTSRVQNSTQLCWIFSGYSSSPLPALLQPALCWYIPTAPMGTPAILWLPVGLAGGERAEEIKVGCQGLLSQTRCHRQFPPTPTATGLAGSGNFSSSCSFWSRDGHSFPPCSQALGFLTILCRFS